MRNRDYLLILLIWLGLNLGLAGFSEPTVRFKTQAEMDRNQGNYPHLKQVQPILNAVSRIRQLPIQRPVDVDTLTRPQLFDKLQAQFRKQVPATKVEGEKTLYTRWQMLPPNFPLESFLMDLYTEQIGGFYDPETQTLYLVKGVPLSGLDAELLIAHELIHALQDQAFDLKPFLVSQEDNNDDRTLAHMALIEGDATVSALEYLQQKLTREPDMLGIFGSLMNMFRMQQGFQQLQKAPPFLKDTLLFPYMQGQAFIKAVQQWGWTWPQFKQVYANPPLSSEQILHPGKYLAHEMPQLPPLAPQSALQPEWKLVTDGVLGELNYQFFFAHHFDQKTAQAATEGWHGDRFQVFKRHNKYLIALNTTWDSPLDVSEFFLAYARSIYKRYPKALRKAISPTALKFELDGDESVMIVRQKQNVLILEGVPQELKWESLSEFVKQSTLTSKN